MLNTITIMGRMTREPELRRTASGAACTSFTLAVERDTFNAKNEKETDYIDCVAWRKEGEFVAKYFKKGQLAVVHGRLQIRNWVDKKQNKRRSAEVIADNVYFGSDKRDAPVRDPGYDAPPDNYYSGYAPSGGYGSPAPSSGYGDYRDGSRGGGYGGYDRFSQPPRDPDYQIHDDFVNDLMDDDGAQLPF